MTGPAAIHSIEWRVTFYVHVAPLPSEFSRTVYPRSSMYGFKHVARNSVNVDAENA